MRFKIYEWTPPHPLLGSAEPHARSHLRRCVPNERKSGPRESNIKSTRPSGSIENNSAYDIVNQTQRPSGFGPPRVWNPGPNLQVYLDPGGPYPLADLVPTPHPPRIWTPSSHHVEYIFHSKSTEVIAGYLRMSPSVMFCLVGNRIRFF